MNIFNFFKKKKIEFFLLQDLKNITNKSGVLILDSSFFIILKITIPYETDLRERSLMIEDELQEIIENYNSFLYVEKELTLSIENNFESILVILIDREKIENIIVELKANKITLLGIFPLFFMEFFNKENKDKIYLEIEKDLVRMYFFKDKKLYNFEEIELINDSLSEKLLILESYFSKNIYVFTYENNKNSTYLSFYFIKYQDWHNYTYFYEKDFNFLPEQYIWELQSKNIIKNLTIITGILLIIALLSFLLLNIYTNKYTHKLNTIQNNLKILNSKIISKKDEIQKLQIKICDTKTETKLNKSNSLKACSLIEAIFLSSSNINIQLIEFNGKNIIKIKGSSINENSIYSFETKLLTYKFFKNINHDFIKYQDNKYIFLIEVEVLYDN